MGDLISIPIGGKARIKLRAHTTDEGIFWQLFVLDDVPLPEIARPTVIVDCGAHIGCSVIRFAQRYPGARIIAIEASLVNYAILVENTAAYPNVTCVNGAIWGEKSRVWISGEEGGEWSFRVASEGAGESLPAFTLDDVMADFQLDHIDILKMDIEGSELNVFQSKALSWLGCTKIIIIELHDVIRPGCSDQFRKTIGPSWEQIAQTGSNIMVERQEDKVKCSIKKS
jgi:FkbM family methyltransferase